MASGTVLGTLFGLPQAWFDSATVPTTQISSGEEGASKEHEDLCAALHSLHTDTAQPAATGPSSSASGWREAGATCLACGIGFNSPGFATAAEQREHFKTDWHRYNVKRRLQKQPPLAEDEFEHLLDASGSEVSSISGSEGSDSSDVDNSQQRRGMSEAAPRATFAAQDGRPFCVWQCLLHRDHVRSQAEPPSPMQQLAALQQLRRSPGLFVVLLLRGGHFAAAVFRSKPQNLSGSSGRQQGEPKAPAAPGTAGHSQGAGAHTKATDWLEVVAHKTFHRYVVRAKAGGKQSGKDASGKYARSAGAALRRYNEARLDEDIAELLASWQQYLDAATLIFVHAPASNARSVFSAADIAGPVVAMDNSRGTSLAAAGAASSSHLINPQDPRVRRIPFATQRPTFTETRRVVGLLLAVFEPTAAAVAAQQAAQEAEQAAAEAHLQRKLARKARKQARADQQQAGDSPAAGPPPGSPVQQPAGDEAEQGPAQQPLQETALHAASRAGDHRAVAQLLQEGANPCARDSRGRTPYAVAADKDARDAFRRHMAAEPEQWDWTAAGVPSPLTDELQAAQAQKKAEKRARQREREKERKAVSQEAQHAVHKAAVEDEIARAAAEAAALAAKLNQAGGKASAAARKVGGAPAATQPRSARGAGGAPAAAAPLTPEEMARRREQMAAAAEARMRALQQASGQQRLY